MIDGVPVTIVRVEPEAEYEGTVYEQSVTIELPDGSMMGLFDKDTMVKADMVGKDVTIVISTLTNASCVEQATNEGNGIQPSSEDPLSWDNHIYWGNIDSILDSSPNVCKILLNVGVGNIIIRLNTDNFSDLKIGDRLRVIATRSDIYDVKITN